LAFVVMAVLKDRPESRGPAAKATVVRSMDAAVQSMPRVVSLWDASVQDSAPVPRTSRRPREPQRLVARAVRRTRKPRRVAVRPRARARVAAARSGPPQGTVSAAQVKAKFRHVESQYDRFRKKFGHRLDGRWQRILRTAVYDRKAEKWERLNRMLDGFRAKMAKIRRQEGQ